MTRIDYSVKKYETIEQLEHQIDSLRLSGLASIEELYQLLSENQQLVEQNGWSTDHLLKGLSEVIKILNVT